MCSGGGGSVALVVGEGRGRDHVIDNGYQPGSDPSAPPDAELVVEQLGVTSVAASKIAQRHKESFYTSSVHL